MRAVSVFLIAVLVSVTQGFAQQEFFPVAKGAKWEYRVTFPGPVKLPYLPVVEYPEGLLAASFFSGMGSWSAGQTNFEVLVGDIVEKTASSTTWKVASNQSLLKFLFFQTDTTMCTCQIRLKNDGTTRSLDIVALLNIAVPPWRLAKYISRVSASDMIQLYPVSVAGGQYANCALSTMKLYGDGQYVPTGTYPVDTYLAPGVGLVKAVGKDPLGATVYTLELSKFTSGAAVSVDADHAAVVEFRLAQNYPNPFNPSTTVTFQVPRSSFVTVNVYNALGVKVATLVSSQVSVGQYDVVWNGGSAPSGIYFCRMQAGTFTSTRKMILLR